MNLKVDFRKVMDFRNGSTVWTHFVKIGTDIVTVLPNVNPLLNDPAVKLLNFSKTEFLKTVP